MHSIRQKEKDVEGNAFSNKNESNEKRDRNGKSHVQMLVATPPYGPGIG
jgi:hypothetical protein